MHHIAIMDKKRNLIEKILTREKTIESRWYVNKIAPWNKVKKGDTVWFKDACCPVSVRALVSSVLQFEKLSYETTLDILQKYGKQIAIEKENFESIAKWAKPRNYCILIFLENPQKVAPFNISKAGFGSACAWMCIENIVDIRM